MGEAKAKKEAEEKALAEAPDTIQFTDVEKLSLENIQLKMVLAQQELERLQSDQKALIEKISTRVGVPEFNKHYVVNLSDGTAKKTSVVKSENQ